MPMNFGTSCEPRQETAYERKRRKRLESHKSIAERTEIWDRVVSLCAVRDRSEHELYVRLGKDGYTSEDIERALERALSCGLVDDKRFADAFIRGKVSAGKGLQGIEKDLEAHNIDPLQFENWPDSYSLDEGSQISRAVDYLNIHTPRAKDKWGAAYKKLLSRGYSPRISSKATRLWAEVALKGEHQQENSA